MRAELSVNRKPKAKVVVKATKSVSAATPSRSTAQKPIAPKAKAASVPSRPAVTIKTKPKTQAAAKSAKPAKKATPKAIQNKTAKAKVAKKVAAKPVGKTKPARAQVAQKPVAKNKVAAKSRTKTRTVIKTTFATIVSAPPIPPELPRPQYSTGAMRAFDQAIKVFNRRQFEDAQPMFEALLSKFQADVEIVARSQMYIQVCKQKLAGRPVTPRNADELYDRGVFALNIGDFSQARSFFEKALRLKPDEPHLLYSLAATHAQSGAHDQALDYLNRSIQMQPRFRAQAFNDTDFSGLRENKQFLQLIGIASPFDRFDSRR